MAKRGVCVCVNLCAGGWVRENETALIPRHYPLGARGGIEHSLEGTTLTASLNTPSNDFSHSGLREIKSRPGLDAHYWSKSLQTQVHFSRVAPEEHLQMYSLTKAACLKCHDQFGCRALYIRPLTENCLVMVRLSQTHI